MNPNSRYVFFNPSFPLWDIHQPQKNLTQGYENLCIPPPPTPLPEGGGGSFLIQASFKFSASWMDLGLGERLGKREERGEGGFFFGRIRGFEMEGGKIFVWGGGRMGWE